MGNAGSSATSGSGTDASGLPPGHPAITTGSKCPLGFGKKKAEAKPAAPASCPVDHTPAPASCPVDHSGSGTGGGKAGGDGKYRNPKVYNVYSQPINPDNNMPNKAAQAKAPGQTKDLSTEVRGGGAVAHGCSTPSVASVQAATTRGSASPPAPHPCAAQRVQSTIPKAGTDSTWLYPSPQMFFNALTRKRKRDTDVSEEDMDTVVAVHNNMNERAWRALETWERCHEGCVTAPVLRGVVPHRVHTRPDARGAGVRGADYALCRPVTAASVTTRGCCGSRVAPSTCPPRHA